MKIKTEVSHAPSQWKVESPIHGKSAITGEVYYDHIIQPLNVLVECGTNKVSATATLIAAAPELLSVVKKLGNLHLEKCENMECAICEEMLAVIKKAEGK